MQSLISKAVAKGIEIYFFGITPLKATAAATCSVTASAETAQEVNTWLKNNRRINGYIDIDKLRTGGFRKAQNRPHNRWAESK